MVTCPEDLLQKSKTRFQGLGVGIVNLMLKELMKSDRVLGVLEVLASLLIGAQLLETLSLQVPLQDLLNQVLVRPLGSQKHIAGLWPQKHCKQSKTLLSNKYLYISKSPNQRRNCLHLLGFHHNNGLLCINDQIAQLNTSKDLSYI